ncbi:VC0807 family protein [Paenibacillus sp. WLX2291]|uniref:VC0807 family protein n=1 Tax=Paenibacillus sp. WLX2291 TaxID=3296934 RepID=UPI0039845007
MMSNLSNMLLNRSTLLTLVINGVLPWLVYMWLLPHTSGLFALSIATLIPLLDNVRSIWKHRKLDVFGGLMLFGFVLSLVMVLLGGSEKLLLMRESFITAAVGLLFLGSLLMPRPLVFYMVARFARSVSPEENWQYSYFRRVMRNMTWIWGIGLLLEVSVKILMIHHLSTTQVLALSTPVSLSMIGGIVLLNIVYRRRAAVHMRQLKEQA